MSKMREHVFKEADTDQNELLSFEEFDAARRRTAAEREDEWKTLEQQSAPVFTEEEYVAYKRMKDKISSLEPTPITKPSHRQTNEIKVSKNEETPEAVNDAEVKIAKHDETKDVEHADDAKHTKDDVKI